MIYRTLKECQDKHPHCKLWIFLNGCGGNLYFVGGCIKYLYTRTHESVKNGEIGFVTISGSGFALLNQFYSENDFDSYDDVYTFWSENYDKNDFYYNIYQWIYKKYQLKYQNNTYKFKHISITSTFNDSNEIEWWYHDCSSDADIGFPNYVKTLVASSHLGFLDGVNKYKGIELDDKKFHRDGGLWLTTPENTLNLFYHVNSKIENVSQLYNISLGLFLNSREKSINLYIKGYNKTRNLIENDTYLYKKLEVYISKNKNTELDEFDKIIKKHRINKTNLIKLINPTFLIENLNFMYKLSRGIMKYVSKKISKNDFFFKAVKFYYNVKSRHFT